MLDLNVVLLLDASSSMGNEVEYGLSRHDIVVERIKKQIPSLIYKGYTASLYSFNSQIGVQECFTRLGYGDLDQIMGALEELPKPQGRSPLAKALWELFSNQTIIGDRIICLADGEDNHPPPSMAEVFQLVAEESVGDRVVPSVFFAGLDRFALEHKERLLSFCTSTGGAFISVSETEYFARASYIRSIVDIGLEMGFRGGAIPELVNRAMATEIHLERINQRIEMLEGKVPILERSLAASWDFVPSSRADALEEQVDKVEERVVLVDQSARRLGMLNASALVGAAAIVLISGIFVQSQYLNVKSAAADILHEVQDVKALRAARP